RLDHVEPGEREQRLPPRRLVAVAGDLRVAEPVDDLAEDLQPLDRGAVAGARVDADASPVDGLLVDDLQRQRLNFVRDAVHRGARSRRPSSTAARATMTRAASEVRPVSSPMSAYDMPNSMRMISTSWWCFDSLPSAVWYARSCSTPTICSSSVGRS